MSRFLLVLAGLTTATPVLASPGWPIFLTAEEVCFEDWCTSQTFELYEDGTFSDGESWTGTWRFAKGVGEMGALRLVYDPWFGWDYVYEGLRVEPDRVTGDVMGFDGGIVGWFTLRKS